MTLSRSFFVSSLAFFVSVSGIPWIPAEEIPTQTQSGRISKPTAPDNINLGVYQVPNVRDANATDAQKVCPGYKLTGVARSNRGLNATLELAGEPCNVYGTDIVKLTLQVEYQSKDRLNVAIHPAELQPSNYSHYILSEEYASRPKYEGDYTSGDGGVPETNVDIDNDLVFTYTSNPFSFAVSRKNHPDDVLFSTTGTKLVFENQFVEFVTKVPSDQHMYGLGETMSNFRLHDNFTRTLYAADNPNNIDENLYGHHPVMLATRYHNSTKDSKTTTTSRSHGVFLRNSHGMDILLRPNHMDKVIYRTIGGSIDLFFYSGGETASAHNVIQSYIKSIGLPAMQQRWTLGFQQTRWGISNVSMMADIVDKYRKANIPLETVYLDIDYMDQYRDFTYDEKNFPVGEFKQLVDEMHRNGQKFIPM